MNTIKNSVLAAVSLIIILTIPSFGQKSFDPQRVIYNQIAPLIQGKYGQNYKFNYTMLDTAVNHSDDDNIQDPYGTLKGCILFSAYKFDSINYVLPDTFIVGMIKNEQIIWDNFPGSKENLKENIVESGLVFAQDINKGGEVDLVYADAQRINYSDILPSAIYIRILSWDGERGKFINSEMLGMSDYELIDPDGDGIYEIRARITYQDGEDVEGNDAYKTSSYPYVTYGWNGTQYGLWPNTKQYAKNQFLPANLFQATMKCIVSMTDGKFQYLYAVTSDAKSKQAIETIYIMNAMSDTANEIAPPGWTASVVSPTLLYFWQF